MAVFPPYAIPRTFPAVTVIFQEPGGGQISRRRGNSYKSKPKPSESLFKSIKRKVKNYFQCFGVRLSRHLGIRQRPAQNDASSDETAQMLRYVRKRGDFPNFDDMNEGQINSMDDCFSDMQEPLYGFITKVTLVDNEPCELGVTCDQEGNKIQKRNAFWHRSRHHMSRHNRQAKRFHQWQRVARKYRRWQLDCRKKRRRYERWRPRFWSFDRQTGEEFVSGAPPDCRTNNICR